MLKRKALDMSDFEDDYTEPAAPVSHSVSTMVMGLNQPPSMFTDFTTDGLINNAKDDKGKKEKKPRELKRIPNPNRKLCSDFVQPVHCTELSCSKKFVLTKLYRPHGNNMFKTDCSCGKTNYKKREDLIDSNY